MVRSDDTEVVPATMELIQELKGRLRKEDQAESYAFWGHSADFAMEYGFKNSAKCWVGLWRGKPLACFGVGSEALLSDKGIPWLLGTEDVRKIKKQFLLKSRIYVKEMLQQFDYLENWVDVRNQCSIQWLKWCGFKFQGLPQRVGRNGELFYRFWLRRDSNV